MSVAGGISDAIGMLIGVVCAGLGLLLMYAVWRTGRTSMGRLPDDGHLAEAWRWHRLEHVADGHATLQAAAARIEEHAIHNGHHLLGLPASRGVRLTVRAEEPREWFLGDAWNVTSTTSTNGRTTTATVQVRAVAAIALDRPVPRVVVGRENALTLLADAAGLRDVQLEGEAFNRSFRVKAERAADAYALLTPELMTALEDADGRFAVEAAGQLVTITEVSGIGGRPAAGQSACLEDIVDVAKRVAAGLRPHTWPDPLDVPDWDGDRTRWRDIVVDDRPPGADHPAAGSGAGIRAIGFGVGGLFAAVGIGLIGATLLGLT